MAPGVVLSEMALDGLGAEMVNEAIGEVADQHVAVVRRWTHSVEALVQIMPARLVDLPECEYDIDRC